MLTDHPLSLFEDFIKPFFEKKRKVKVGSYNFDREKNRRVKVGSYNFDRKDYVFQVQNNYADKYIVCELLKRLNKLDDKPTLKIGDLEFRFSYFIYYAEENTWKQSKYHPMIPPKDLRILLQKLEEKGHW